MMVTFLSVGNGINCWRAHFWIVVDQDSETRAPRRQMPACVALRSIDSFSRCRSMTDRGNSHFWQFLCRRQTRSGETNWVPNGNYFPRLRIIILNVYFPRLRIIILNVAMNLTQDALSKLKRCKQAAR